MRYLILSLLFAIAISCSSDDYRNYNNPNLIRVPVNYSINLNLPQFNPLIYDGRNVVIDHIGIKGVVVHRLNSNLFIALELSDPNHPPSSCSKMVINGLHAECKCPNDKNSYNIITGEHTSKEGMYPMLGYKAVREGNTIRIYN